MKQFFPWVILCLSVLGHVYLGDPIAFSSIPLVQTLFQHLFRLLILASTIYFVILLSRPKSEQPQHAPEFLRRRFSNWFPLGIAYALLYMGRYNFSVAKASMASVFSNEEFGWIGGVGTFTYGFAFLLNGPLADQFGGKRTMLWSLAGSCVSNLLMGLCLQANLAHGALIGGFMLLYALNMYFQSFGAVSIVKVNAPWFLVKERGQFGGVFGIMISMGIFFAYEWGSLILKFAEQLATPTSSIHYEAVFYIPALLLLIFFFIIKARVVDQPEEAGFAPLVTGEESLSSESLSIPELIRKVFAHPVIRIICLIELCSGFLRQAIMQWYPTFAKAVHLNDSYVPSNWGLLLCEAGILGGMFAGVISDKLFQSRRGPVVGFLYGILLFGSLLCLALFSSSNMVSVALGWVMIIMSLSVIGIHGMLSGTASMDFAGKANVGKVVGLIDGMVYLGTFLQFVELGYVTPDAKSEAGKVILNWWPWCASMIPFAFMGLWFSKSIWKSKPNQGSTAH